MQTEARAWLTELKIWIPEFFICNKGQYFIFDDYGNFLPSPFKEEVIITHFTGQFDKQGRKIFGGDILKVCWIDDSCRGNIKENLIVSWGEKEAAWITDSKRGIGKYFGLSCFGDKVTTEIIGNIFENPELII